MIQEIFGYKVFDSRGDPALLVEIKTEKGKYFGSAPSGKSRGKHEAKALSIDKSLKILEKIKENFLGMEEEDFEILDELLVEIAGENFEKIGSHIGFALTSSLFKASFNNTPWKYFENLKFPFPIGNVIGGGVHGGNTDIQEFHVIPTQAETIEKAVETNLEVYRTIKTELKKRGKLLGKNDENAWICSLDDRKTMEFLSKIAEDFGVRLGVDVAASSLYQNGNYIYENLGKKIEEKEQLYFISDLIESYNLLFIEDPFHEEDFESHKRLAEKFPRRIICGDDLFVTNKDRLRRGLEIGACNSILIKPNQVGSIGLAIETAGYAIDNGYTPVLSHRSGETNDWIIADLALGLSPLIKTGVAGGERLAKLNRLIYLWDKFEEPKMAEF